jgi:hypothetical protein
VGAVGVVVGIDGTGRRAVALDVDVVGIGCAGVGVPVSGSVPRSALWLSGAGRSVEQPTSATRMGLAKTARDSLMA